MLRYAFGVVALLGVTPAAAIAGAIWTGLGADDRWANPGNWADEKLPTGEDDLVEDPSFGWWQNWPHARQVTVTIDGSAAVRDWTVPHYRHPPGVPFGHINIVAGADFRARHENINHEIALVTPPNYVQSGGTHTVGEFRYASGEFRMTGGTFIADQILAVPDNGVFSLLGGQTRVGRLEVGTYPTAGRPRFNVGGTADVHVTDTFHIRVDLGTPEMSFTRPIYMDGADFTNPHQGIGSQLRSMHLVFGGALSDVARVEASSLDQGASDPAGWTGNGTIGTIEIGGDQPAHVRLVDEFANWYNAAGDNAQYVDTLRITSGSILDLNGLNLYCRVLDDRGGTFLNGEPTVVPEPAGAGVLLLAAAAATATRPRRRRP